jgi:hypothetical protein
MFLKEIPVSRIQKIVPDYYDIQQNNMQTNLEKNLYKKNFKLSKSMPLPCY